MSRKWIDYDAYLKSDKWKEKQQLRFEIDNNKCIKCGNPDTLQTHHLTYERIGDENIETDLITLCMACHAIEHNKFYFPDKEPEGQRYIKSGEMMQGICIQWFHDTYGEGTNFIKNGGVLYDAILRKTFGYRQRFNYIPQNFFGLNSNTLKKYRDRLTELGILEWKKTRQMTMYKILEPANEISTFVFTKHNDEEDREKAKIEQYNANNQNIDNML